ncbi:hypothetical protein TNCV_4954301 [Trichonephila clavipes]|nr:hypothetical protein TNCV_4954301 [Trichonephila clavipes]
MRDENIPNSAVDIKTFVIALFSKQKESVLKFKSPRNLNQVARKTPESASPVQTTSPYRQEDIELDRFNMHQLPLYNESLVAPGLDSTIIRHEFWTITARL